MARVAGKVALITGGASGLGLATAKLMAAEGARIVITDIQKNKGPAAAKEIGGDAIFLEHDVTSEERWQQVVAETEKKFGKINIVVMEGQWYVADCVREIKSHACACRVTGGGYLF